MNFRIRPALPTDIPALAVLAASTFPLACPPEMEHAAIETFVRQHLDEIAFRRYLDDPMHTVLLALASNSPAAYALLLDGTDMDSTCAHLLHGRRPVGVSKFYLTPSLHGSGVATALLESVVIEAGEKGADSLWLATNAANTRARRFYERSGFVERGNRKFDVGGTQNNDVVYERCL